MGSVFNNNCFVMIKNVADLRQEYTAATLDIADTAANPIDQFEHWFADAIRAEVKEPNAFTLATINDEGRPRARVVLLKGFDKDGFVFYTNYSSAKAAELLAHPYAAMNFFWYDLERQVRIEGKIEKVSTETSREYFQSRPKSSQIGAWASPQSKVITDRTILDAEMERLSQQYASEDVLPLPPHWGGYLIRPDLIEFWQGRRSRLHDRVRYRLENGLWVKELLAP